MIYEKLLKVQQTLKAPKNQYNSFGEYRFRSCEDILEAAKPLLGEQRLILLLSDEIQHIGDRNYVVATATLIDTEEKDFLLNTLTVRASAGEAVEKKKLDESQLTGSASSYARKYALNGLFLIDDNKDADTDEYTKSSTYSSKQKTASKTASKSIEQPKNSNQTVQQHFSELTRNIKKEQKQNIHLWCVAEYGEDYFSKDEALNAAIKQFALEK